MRVICINENILYINYMYVNIFVVILYYSFGKCYYWGNMDKGCMEFFFIMIIVREFVFI